MALIRWIGRASSSIRPDDGFTNPVTASMTVVLPAPLGPIRPTTSPGPTSKDTSRTATTLPNRTVSPRTDRVAGGTSSGSTSGSSTGRGRVASRRRPASGRTAWVTTSATPFWWATRMTITSAAPTISAHSPRSSMSSSSFVPRPSTAFGAANTAPST